MGLDPVEELFDPANSFYCRAGPQMQRMLLLSFENFFHPVFQ
jgi:hypothetical protein